MQNVLVCDDDEAILESLRIYLDNAGFNVITAVDGQDALEKIQNNEVHCVVLDIMMPRLDGLKATLKIREKYNFPIILLSAKSEDTDKITGLGFGADDYVTKPFNPLELIARVNSGIRRYTKLNTVETKKSNIYKSGELILDDDLKRVSVDGKDVKLTSTEFNILKFLIKNKGKVYSIDEIYQNVWGDDAYGVENVIAVHIRHIREKLEINPKEPKYLKVIWGIGYKIENL